MENVNKIVKASAYLLAIGLLLFYFTGGLYKYLIRMHGIEFRFGPLIKGFYQLIIILYLFLSINKNKLHLLAGIFVLVIIFLIGQFSLHQNFDVIHFKENIILLFRYIFILLSFALAFDLIQNKAIPSVIEKSYRFLWWVNIILVLAGLIFNLYWAASYKGNWRFGYNGLFYAQNDTSFMYIFALTYFYYRVFYLKKNDILFWLILVASLMVGTKALYLYVILLFGFHIFRKVKFKHILIFGISSVFLVYINFYSLINKIILKSIVFFEKVYREKGFWYALTSGRNEFFEMKLFPLLSKWNFANYIFGGQDIVNYNMEMDFIDQFLFFGILGFLLYFFLFNYLIKNLLLPKDLKIFFILSIFALAFAAGHLFNSDMVGIHFIFFILLIYSEKLNQKHSFENDKKY